MESVTVREDKTRGLVKRIIVASAVAVSVLALNACNTTEGVGKDIKSAGKGLEEAAQENK